MTSPSTRPARNIPEFLELIRGRAAGTPSPTTRPSPLHTTNAARLTGEEHLRGTLTPGRLADITIWDRDPAHCPSDTLRDLNPTHAFVGGRLVAHTGTRHR
ncbi:amidohydrolase family protein [Streptomyces violascens]|uniref:amidohydrolase family protein n=1 Tax=Streptomyces violascens TaxID=67381 RepID=UPI00369ABF1D